MVTWWHMSSLPRAAASAPACLTLPRSVPGVRPVPPCITRYIDVPAWHMMGTMSDSPGKCRVEACLYWIVARCGGMWTVLCHDMQTWTHMHLSTLLAHMSAHMRQAAAHLIFTQPLPRHPLDTLPPLWQSRPRSAPHGSGREGRDDESQAERRHGPMPELHGCQLLRLRDG
jgi:hypothetical protein